MADKKLRIFPTGSSVFNTQDKMYEYQQTENQELHNAVFQHSTSTSQTLTIDNGSNWSQSPYSGTVKSFSSNGGNPFGKPSGGGTESCIVTGQSWDHSYGSYFRVGQGSQKLWIPNITGLALHINCNNTSNDDKQKTFITDVALGYYKQHTNQIKTLQLPFSKETVDGISCVVPHRSTRFKYATLSSSDRSIIFDKDYMFAGVWFKVYILRGGAMAKIPKISIYGLQPIMHSNGSHFIVPKELRDTQKTTSPIRYL